MAIRNSQDVTLSLNLPAAHQLRNSQEVILLIGSNITFAGTATQLQAFSIDDRPIRFKKRNPIIDSVTFCPGSASATRRFSQPQFFIIT